MRYRLLGRSGLRVSEIALGTMTFSATAARRGARPSPGADWSWCATEADAEAIFRAYVERGGNFIDTADVYAAGSAEPLVGQLIAPRRDQLVVATKFGLAARDSDVAAGGSSYRTMVRAVDASLRRLGTDRIELLYLHAWDGITPLDEIARGFESLVQAGKALYAGVSDTPAWAIATLHSCYPITAVQVRYSMADRAAELELLPMARHLGIGAVAFGVLGGGRLTGGDSPRQRAATPDHGVASATRTVAGIARARGATQAQIALGWMRQRETSSHVIPIVGARTPDQLRDTMAGLDLALGAADIAALDELAPPPRIFPHDIADAIAPELQGGAAHAALDLPADRAF